MIPLLEFGLRASTPGVGRMGNKRKLKTIVDSE
jgi:hypothetical protein